MKYKLSTFLFSVLLFVGSAHVAFGAELRFSSDATTPVVGDTVKVKVIVNSTEPINAISGQISFPKNLLQVQSISKTNSMISQWPVEPTYSNANGNVSWEGVSLSSGGYKGAGTVLTVVFKAKAIGTGTIQIASGSVLANDGEGTNVLTGRAGIALTIGQLTQKEKVTPVKEVSVDKILTPQIKIEEIKKQDEMDPRSRFLITGVGRNVKVPYQIEIDTVSQAWEDTGSHIFETNTLARGAHTVKVSMTGRTGEIISTSISFTTNGIMVPIITDYSNDISENDFIVIKGMADPMAYIMITSDGIISGTATPRREAVTVRANEKGLFTYASEHRAVKGIYMISARARSESGVESETTAPLRLAVFGNFNIVKRISDVLSLAVPFVSLILLFGVILIYGVYRVMHYRKHLTTKLRDAEALIEKSFAILEEDLNEEVKIFKKVKALEPLTDEEKVFVKQFKKDLRSAEKVIVAEVKNTKKTKS